MNWKKSIGFVVCLTLSAVAITSCVVSKKEYLLKVEDAHKLSRELGSLRSAHDQLKGEKAAVDKQVLGLQKERSDLEKMRTELRLKNHALENDIALLAEDNLKLDQILRSKSDNLRRNIVDLRDHVADLKKENNLLKTEISALQDQVAELREKNNVLQSEAHAIERQRQEDILEMKGTYEHLLEDMKSEIDKGKITITQLKGKLKVNMLDEILFDSGKTTIKTQGVEVLDRVGNILMEVKDKAITIEGHTDNVPIGAELSRKYPTNWELSAARACNVARYLQEKIGIDPIFLSATGYGEYQPIASNETEEERAKNRRIEILLIPKETSGVSRK